MAGIKALRKLQLGREDAAGTAEDATTVWRGEGTIEDLSPVVFVAEDVGIIGGTDRSYIPKKAATINFVPTPATYEQLPHILDAGIMRALPAADGAGSGWIRTYNVPETSKPTIMTYTIEGGDDQQEEEFTYGFVRDFTLEGKAGEAWNMSAVWDGRQVDTGTYTASVTIPDVEEMLFSKNLLYIDAIGAAYGTTLKSNTLLAASLKYTTGWVPVFAADGQLYFSFAKITKPEILLDVTFEHDGTAVTEIAARLTETSRKIRIKCTGATLATAGTTYSVKTMIIDLPGKWESFTPLGEQDGNDIVTGTFRSRYNITAADAGQIVIVNEVSSLTLNPSASVSVSVSPSLSPSGSASPSPSVSPSA